MQRWQASTKSFFLRTLWCAIFTCSLLATSFAWTSSAAAYQDSEAPSLVRIPPAAMREHRELDELLQRGQDFEQQGRWREAIEVYERGVRRFGNNIARQRLESARRKFDVQRRFNDPGYIHTITANEERVAAGVCSEVLLKIDAYHVDRPEWAAIARSGVDHLRLAFEQAKFREVALPANARISNEAIATEVERLFRRHSFSSRHDIIDFVHDVSSVLRQRWGIAPSPIYYEFACAGLSSLDWYSSFLTKEQYDETISQIDGNFVGLGVELKPFPDHLEVVSVIANGPAGEAGLASGDRIVAVETTWVSEIGGDPAADRLRGPEGSLIDLTVDPIGGDRQTIRLRRRRVEIPSLEGVNMIDPENGIAYIHLSSFQRTTLEEFQNALWRLHRDGMRSLIVDVRGNPGGLLDASVDVANLFLTDGTIVSTRGRNPNEDRVREARFEGTWQVPLTVLIDSQSASASEIFAGAIRDHGRGVLIGEKSYGKGSVQGIFPLNTDGGGIRLTTAKFFSPVGQAISDRGVSPDITVETRLRADGQNDGQATDEDQVLATAVRHAIERQSARR